MVDIIPKPIKRPSPWQKILFYISFALLMTAISSYFTLGYLEEKYSFTIQDIEENLERLKTPEEKALEEEILMLQKKIKDFSILIEAHKKPSNFFKVLEEFSHPMVWFSKFGIDTDQARVTVSGQAQDFQSLDQQLFIFRDQSLIKNVNLSEISLGEEGGVGFSLILDLDPQVFK